MDWLSIVLPVFVTGCFGVIVAVITARAAIKSQKRTIELAHAEKTRQDEQEAAKERLSWFNELQEERNHLRDIANKLEEQLKQSHEKFEQMSRSYRAYIHTLRGEVYDLGGRPSAWPADVDQ